MSIVDFTELLSWGGGVASAQRFLDAAARNDFTVFIRRCFETVTPGQDYRHNWHIEAIAYHLEQVRVGDIKRLIITMPPRSLKSICASVAFPAWLLAHDPTSRIICASYSQDLSANLSTQCRAVLMNEWYMRAFPRTRIDPSKNTEGEMMTTRRGSRFATSVGGTLTGRGGGTIIIDDPIKPSDGMSKPRRENVQQWFDNTVYSRLDDKNEGSIVLVMQRVHMEDLAGYLLEKGGWTHLNLPAIGTAPDQKIPIGPGRFATHAEGDILHPERENRDVLENIKKTIGSYLFSAQYLQQPIPAGGTLIPWDWFQFYDEAPIFDRDRNHRITMSWDTASKVDELANYSVGQTWHWTPKGYFLTGLVRRKLDFPDLRRLIIDQAKAQNARTVLIEDRSSGTGLIQDLNEWHHWAGWVRPAIIPIVPKEDKIMRMHLQTAKIEGGQVFLPRRAEWLDDFKAEVSAFPNGANDDQVDAMSQDLLWEDIRRGRIVEVA